MLDDLTSKNVITRVYEYVFHFWSSVFFYGLFSNIFFKLRHRGWRNFFLCVHVSVEMGFKIFTDFLLETINYYSSFNICLKIAFVLKLAEKETSWSCFLLYYLSGVSRFLLLFTFLWSEIFKIWPFSLHSRVLFFLFFAF